MGLSERLGRSALGNVMTAKYFGLFLITHSGDNVAYPENWPEPGKEEVRLGILK